MLHFRDAVVLATLVPFVVLSQPNHVSADDLPAPTRVGESRSSPGTGSSVEITAFTTQARSDTMPLPGCPTATS